MPEKFMRGNFARNVLSASGWLCLILNVPPKKNSADRARQKILAQWRGVDYAPLEKARATPAKNAGDFLPQLFKDLKLDARRHDAEIIKVWNSLIDPAVTAHAQPANLHKGTLFVNVDSSAWLSEIVRYRRKEILERLQNSFGKSVVQKISFRVG
jgi:Dna[CI] antecedent, DciA